MKKRMGLREKIRKGEPVSAPLAGLLSVATLGQRVGMWWRMQQPVTQVNARVISYGNLTAGGSGKTPAVIERAERELKSGHKVAVISRGYGSQKVKEPYLIAPADSVDAQRLGDELALIRRRVPGVCLVKSADRVAGANAAIAAWGCDTLILDDGYQALNLARDENILLIDARNPFGNGALLPRGILREVIPNMKRATEVIITHSNLSKKLPALHDTIRQHCGDIEIRHAVHRPCGLWQIDTGEEHSLDFLKGKEVHAACAIAHPEGFFESLEALGARILERSAFPDHADIPANTFGGPLACIVTEKDAVRIPQGIGNVYALAIRLEFLDAEPLC